MRHTHRLVVLLSLGLAAHASADKIRYTITNIGTLGGDTTRATGLNNGGQVTGQDYNRGETKHSFLFSNGVLTDIGSLTTGEGATATAINSSGAITGQSYIGSEEYRAFFYELGTMVSRGGLGGTRSIGYALNDAGDIAGSSRTSGDSTEHAMLLPAAGLPIDLGTLGGSASYAYGINANLDVVGEAQTAGGETRAFLYTALGGMIDLTTLGGSISIATDINDSGQIVGFSTTATDNNFHPFIYEGGTIRELVAGGGPGTAAAINNAGQIVGTVNSGTGSEHAFLYAAGVLTDLNTRIVTGTGWEFYEAGGINDSGQIVANGHFQGQNRAALLTPVNILTPTVTINHAPRATARRARYRIRGLATSDVTGVTYTVRRGRTPSAVRPADGTGTWSALARVRPGRNVFLVTATGYGGTSAAARLVVIRN